MLGLTMTTAASELRLQLDGMSCASCAASIERRLNEVDGVKATVNLVTEQAPVHVAPGVRVEELVEAVESVGYRAHVAQGLRDHDEQDGPLARRLASAVVLTVPVALLAMLSALRFDGWE